MSDRVYRSSVRKAVADKTIEKVTEHFHNGCQYWRLNFTDKTFVDVRPDSLFDVHGNNFAW